MLSLRGKTFFAGYRFFRSEGWYSDVDTLSWANKTVSVALVPLDARAVLTTGPAAARNVVGNGASRRVRGEGAKRNLS